MYEIKGCNLIISREIHKENRTHNRGCDHLSASTSYDVSAVDPDRVFSLESSSVHQQKTNYFRPKIRI
jgi:hypothetical protein